MKNDSSLKYFEIGRSHSGSKGGSGKIFVSNLNYETGWRELKDHMRKAGDVLRADIVQDERGRSRGYG